MGLRQVMDAAVRTVVRGARLNHASLPACTVAGQIAPIYVATHKGETYKLACPNPLTLWRARTYFSTEPETLKWIESFDPSETLFDIGANVGLYSIYAARRGVKVLAFEPQAHNYALLNTNLELNALDNKVMALNLAMSDRDSLDFLYLPKSEAGAALNNFGEPRDLQHKPFTAAFKQGALSFSIDSFVEKFPQTFPNHIKIDVDGIENAIVNGAQRTLRDGRLKSVLLEINEALPSDRAMVDRVLGAGFRLLPKERSAMFAGGAYDMFWNYIFVR